MLKPKKLVSSVRMRLESWHYQPLVIGALKAGWGLYRIEDGGYGRKPCDIGGFDNEGRGVILEVKTIEYSLSKDEPLPWGQFELHQKEWLFLAEERSALSLVALYTKSSGEMQLYHVQRIDTPASDLLSEQLTADYLDDGTFYWGTTPQWNMHY
jgi:hypothetical protein